MEGPDPATPARNGDDGEIAELLIAVAARLSRLHSIVLARLETRLTFRQYRTLTRVAHGDSSLSQLAARANLSVPTVSENVEGLVRRGLMTATPSQTDRRATVLEVTDAGRIAIAAADRALHDVVNRLVTGVPADDLAITATTLSHIYREATSYFQEHLTGAP